MRKILGIAVVIAVFFCFMGIALAYQPIKLFINDSEVKTDVPPQLVKGRTLVPLRVIAEKFGAEVNWNPIEKTVKVIEPASTYGTGISEILEEYINKTPIQLKGGELSLGAIPRRNGRFLLPVLAALNKYLAQKQEDSLLAKDSVLTRYELLEGAYTTGGMFWHEDTAYEIAVRLYYSHFAADAYPPYVIRLYEEKKADGVHGSVEELTVEKSWYEDVVFTVRPIGNVARIIEENGGQRKVWIQGENGWYVDTSATQVLKKVDLKEMPIPFDIPLP